MNGYIWEDFVNNERGSFKYSLGAEIVTNVNMVDQTSGSRGPITSGSRGTVTKRNIHDEVVLYEITFDNGAKNVYLEKHIDRFAHMIQ